MYVMRGQQQCSSTTYLWPLIFKRNAGRGQVAYRMVTSGEASIAIKIFEKRCE